MTTTEAVTTQHASVKKRNEISIIVLLAACLVLYSLTGNTTIVMMESNSVGQMAETTTTTTPTTNPSSSKGNDDLNSDSPTNHCELQLPANVASAMFHPQSFFENGPGNPWLHVYQTNVQVDFKAVEYAAFRFVKPAAPRNNECQSVHLHLKKCGGTTASNALKNAGLLGPRSDRFKFTDKHGNQLRTIYEHQVNASLPTIPVFTFIRDPVSRFFSGLNQFQTLISRFPNTHPISVALREENETIPMLERVIESIHNHSSFLNVHLLPQAFEMYKMTDAPGDTNKHDIAIQIFNLHDINAVLETVGVPRDLIQARNTAENRKNKQHHATYKHSGRHHDAQIQKHNIETSVLTPELQRKICDLYAMDVKMIRETGIGATSCQDE